MTPADRVDHFFGPALALCHSPMPEGAMREIIRHESAGLWLTVVADQVDGASELGGTQLVVEHDAAANPNPKSKSGAIGANVDPLTPLGAVYGAQWVYARTKVQFTKDMEAAKVLVPSDLEVALWISVMEVQHSIGRGGFIALLKLGVSRGLDDPTAILRHFAEDEMPPKIGRMMPKLVRRRIFDLLDLPSQAAKIEPLPASIGPLCLRPFATPVFNAARAKRFILAERQRVAEHRRRYPGSGSPL